MTDDESDDEPYESGPFCRHWGSLGDCDELCKCGHTCGRHDDGETDGPGGECFVDGCTCTSFQAATPKDGDA